MRIRIEQRDEAGDVYEVGISPDDEGPILSNLGTVRRTSPDSWLFEGRGSGGDGEISLNIEAKDIDGVRAHFDKHVAVSAIPVSRLGGIPGAAAVTPDVLDDFVEALLLASWKLARLTDCEGGFLAALASAAGNALSEVTDAANDEKREACLSLFAAQVRTNLERGVARGKAREELAAAVRRVFKVADVKTEDGEEEAPTTIKH